jgi:phosphoglycerate kinase
MALTFLKARGVEIGESRFEKDQVFYARELMKRLEARGKHLILPIDHRVALEMGSPIDEVKTVEVCEGPYKSFDIGPITEALFADWIGQARTVFWNGPVGVFEQPAFQQGSFAVAKAMAANKAAYRVVGGGDSAAAMMQSGFADQVDHISTGGGASLEYIQGTPLPGLEVLREKF